MNLILLRRDEVRDAIVHVEGVRARHMAGVLRVRPGSTVRLGIVDGPTGIGTVVQVAGESVTLDCCWSAEALSDPKLDLLLALPRPKVMRRLWAQLAALGVGRIVLTNAARVERNYFDTHVLDPAHFEPLLIEGLQQAGATRLPLVEIHRRFRPMLEDAAPGWGDYGEKLLLHPAPATPLALHSMPHPRVMIAVGPEGGWIPFELDLLERAGFRRMGMGDRILRSDTACIAAMALVRHALAIGGQTT